MPTLASSLLGITSLVSGLSELGGVKNHIFRASREILLAIQDLLDLVENRVSETSTPNDIQEKINQVIGYSQKILNNIVKQLPRNDEDEYRTLHRKVMHSILEVLESEIRKNQKRKNNKAKMKIEVLEAIRNVLLKEMYEQETTRSGGKSDEHQ